MGARPLCKGLRQAAPPKNTKPTFTFTDQRPIGSTKKITNLSSFHEHPRYHKMLESICALPLQPHGEDFLTRRSRLCAGPSGQEAGQDGPAQRGSR